MACVSQRFCKTKCPIYLEGIPLYFKGKVPLKCSARLSLIEVLSMAQKRLKEPHTNQFFFTKSNGCFRGEGIKGLDIFRVFA